MKLSQAHIVGLLFFWIVYIEIKGGVLPQGIHVGTVTPALDDGGTVLLTVREG